LRVCCQQDEQRRIHGKPHTVGEAMRIERDHLLPLASEGFELAETSFPVVDGHGCVKVRTNRYSVPLRVGSRTQVRLLPAYVEVWHEQRCVRVTSATSVAISRCLIWSITWMCWGGSRAHWPVRRRSNSGESGGAGGEFRPLVAELARAAREACWHARDDRTAPAGPTIRVECA